MYTCKNRMIAIGSHPRALKWAHLLVIGLGMLKYPLYPIISLKARLVQSSDKQTTARLSGRMTVCDRGGGLISLENSASVVAL